MLPDRSMEENLELFMEKHMDCWMLEVNCLPYISTEGHYYEQFFYPCIRDIIYLYSKLNQIKIPNKKKHGWIKI